MRELLEEHRERWKEYVEIRTLKGNPIDKIGEKQLAYMGFLFGQVIVGGVRSIFSYWLTMLWISAWLIVMIPHNKPLIAALIAIFLAVHVGAYFVPFLNHFTMFASDYRRKRKKREKQDQAYLEYYNKHIRAQDYIVYAGLVGEEDADQLESWMEEDEDTIVLHWRDELRGKGEEYIARSLIEYKKKLKAIRAEVREDDDMELDIIFFKTDPLDRPHQIHKPVEIDLSNMSLEIGVLSDGSHHSISFKEKPVSLIGGESGSGKTRAVAGALSAFSGLREDVELHIIDNKGGDDWSAFEPVARTFMPIDGYEKTLDDVLEFFENLAEERKIRTKSAMKLFGVSNWWEATPEQRREAGLPFLLVVIDECDELFDKQGKKPAVRSKIEEIEAIATSIAKMGRSTGIHLMFITQKPTSESLPTGIKNQARIRIALSVQEDPAEIAILGPSPQALNVPRAISIPTSRPGGAVFADDQRSRWMGRFFFFSEKDQLSYFKELDKTLDRENESNFLSKFENREEVKSA